MALSSPLFKAHALAWFVLFSPNCHGFDVDPATIRLAVLCNVGVVACWWICLSEIVLTTANKPAAVVIGTTMYT